MINVKFHGILKKTLGKRSYKTFEELRFFVKNNIYPAKILEKPNEYIVVPLISGEGGGKGKGQTAPTPLLQPPAPDENALQSFSQSEVVDLICEGPIDGFCTPNGDLATQASDIAKGVYLNGTVVQNANGSYNYRKLALNYAKGGHEGINPLTDTWARSKIYNTQSIKQSLVGPNMKSNSDGDPQNIYGSADFGSMISLMQQEGKTSIKSDFNTSAWFSKNGSHIGYFLGTAGAGSSALDAAKKYGYAASQIEHGSDIRTFATRRDFTSWSAGHAEFSEAGFPVSHTITNPEVDFAYITISVDDLKDTVDHGEGAGKVGLMTTSREHKVGFQVEIGVNGLTDEEAGGEEFTNWLSYHGISQTDPRRKSITRNYFIQGLVAGSNYLIDVGRATFGDDGELRFGEDNDTDEGMNSLEDGENPAAVFNATELKGTTSDQAIPHDFAPSAEEPSLGLNRFRQFGQNSGLRDAYEDTLRTSFMPIRDANNAYNCFKMPPPIAGKTRYIKVTKTGRELISPIMSSKISFDTVTEIIDEKMAYPYSAIIQQSFNSRYFSEKPDRSYHLRLIKILIPSNYDADKRHPGGQVYTGDWSGTFKYAWSDNPAWILYDLMINNRYGIGAYLDINKIDKWTLYKIGRYCDAVNDNGVFVGVDDANNGREPRYTMNVMISEEEEAYELLKTIAETFHGIAYWDGRGVSISLDGGSNTVDFSSWESGRTYNLGDIVEFPDSTFNFFKKTRAEGNRIRPGVDNNWEYYWQKVSGVQVEDPAIVFTNTNVEGGTFSYFTSSKSSRYTVARVGYMDKNDNFRKKYEYVEDKQGVKELGVIRKNIEPLGCTSQGQARRMGRWFFLTSSVNTETITFSTDYRALFLKPGNVIGVNDSLKNTNQEIGKIIKVDPSNSQILELTHSINVFARDNETGQDRYYDIILGNIDPSYDVEFLNNKGPVSPEDIENLNKPQRIRGSVRAADGSSRSTNKIKVVDENGTFLKFTNSLESMYSDSSLYTVQKGSDWAIVTPQDGGEYGEDWKERKYRIQAIEEEGEGKYKIIAVYFNEEKLSSMDQTFPIITPEYDITLDASNISANITPPIVEGLSVSYVGGNNELTLTLSFNTTVDESKFNTITHSIILISPNGDQTDASAQVSAGAGRKSTAISTGIKKGSPSATGVWSVIVTTSAIESTTGRSKTSAAGTGAAVIADETYGSGNPQVSELKAYEDGSPISNRYGGGATYYVVSSNPTIDARWEYTDINEALTKYDTTSTLNSSSPFFRGFKIGFCPVVGGIAQTNNIIWIYDENNLYKKLEYSFPYDLRFNTIIQDDQPQFQFNNLVNQRVIALIVQPAAQAGDLLRLGDTRAIIIHDQQTTFSAQVSSQVVEFRPATDVFYDIHASNLDGARQINIIESIEQEDGDVVDTPRKIGMEDPPDGAEFDYDAEIAEAGISRIYTVDAALELWETIKNNTINSKRAGYQSEAHPGFRSAWSFDEIKKIATAYEDGGAAAFTPSQVNSLGVHFVNYSIVNFWKQEELTNKALIQELGSFSPIDIEFTEENKTTLQANNPEDAGENTLAGFDSLAINISGDTAFTQAGPKTSVGYAALYINRNNPNFEYSEETRKRNIEDSDQFLLPYDEQGDTSINYDRDYYFQLRVFDSFTWKNSLLSEEDKVTSLESQTLDFGVTGFMIIPQEDLQDLSSDDEDADTLDDLGHAFVNTFGDERIVGIKQFREGIIIGGTNEWARGETAASSADSFVKYPLATQKSFQGTPVGIGQYNLSALERKTFEDLKGEGDSSSTFQLTSGSINSLEDFHVSVKGMNIQCISGDDGNYDGQGGTISGNIIKTAGFEAGNTVNFKTEPNIDGTPLSAFVQSEGLNSSIENAINNSTRFADLIEDTTFTENFKISGNATIGVEGTDLVVRAANGLIYRIELTQD